MALKVRDAATAMKKFVARGQAAAGDYADGVRGAGQDWQAKTVAAAETYATGVTESIGRNAFARGVQDAGGARYEQKASTVGAQRFPQGIREAGGDWERGTAPYLGVLAGLTLPPRRPKGDPANYARVQAVGDALRRRKVGS
jgi:hypothetical protein